MKNKKLNSLLFTLIIMLVSLLVQPKVGATACSTVSGSEFGYNGNYYETLDCLCYYYPEAPKCETEDDTTTKANLAIVGSATGVTGKVAGIKYQIYNNLTCTGTVLYTDTTNSIEYNYHEITLNSDYCIKITDVPDGYEIPDNITGTMTSTSGVRKTIKLSPLDNDDEDDTNDTATTGTLKLSFKDSEDSSYISGIGYKIYSTYSSTSGCSGTVKYTGTSKSSATNITLDLKESKYCLSVTSVPSGYSTPQDTAISMAASNSKTINVDKKVDVEDTMSNISIAIIVVGIIGLTAGAYLVYKNMKEKKLSE